MTCLLQAIQLKSSLAKFRVIVEAEPMLRRSDEIAYSIMPSRLSSLASRSNIKILLEAQALRLRKWPASGRGSRMTISRQLPI